MLICLNFTRLSAKPHIMDHAIFCCIHLAHYRLRQYLRHAHTKVPLICEKHLPTKYSRYATVRRPTNVDIIRNIKDWAFNLRARDKANVYYVITLLTYFSRDALLKLCDKCWPRTLLSFDRYLNVERYPIKLTPINPEWP